MAGPKYLGIVAHYEACLDKHGDTHRGVDWPNAEDAQTRYRVMLEVVKPNPSGKVTLLDFGCGASHLYDYLRRHDRQDIVYSGLDLSEKFIALSRAKYPANSYHCLDLLTDAAALPEFDYIVMNGVFTEKRELTFDEMYRYFQALVRGAFAKTRVGLAFNVMSKQVDWERDDLFHLPLDLLATFLTSELSRDFVIRHDYRLFEYTTYIYRRQ